MQVLESKNSSFRKYQNLKLLIKHKKKEGLTDALLKRQIKKSSETGHP